MSFFNQPRQETNFFNRNDNLPTLTNSFTEPRMNRFQRNEIKPISNTNNHYDNMNTSNYRTSNFSFNNDFQKGTFSTQFAPAYSSNADFSNCKVMSILYMSQYKSSPSSILLKKYEDFCLLEEGSAAIDSENALSIKHLISSNNLSDRFINKSTLLKISQLGDSYKPSQNNPNTNKSGSLYGVSSINNDRSMSINNNSLNYSNQNRPNNSFFNPSFGKSSFDNMGDNKGTLGSQMYRNDQNIPLSGNLSTINSQTNTWNNPTQSVASKPSSWGSKNLTAQTGNQFFENKPSDPFSSNPSNTLQSYQNPTQTQTTNLNRTSSFGQANTFLPSSQLENNKTIGSNFNSDQRTNSNSFFFNNKSESSALPSNFHNNPSQSNQFTQPQNSFGFGLNSNKNTWNSNSFFNSKPGDSYTIPPQTSNNQEQSFNALPKAQPFNPSQFSTHSFPSPQPQQQSTQFAPPQTPQYNNNYYTISPKEDFLNLQNLPFNTISTESMINNRKDLNLKIKNLEAENYKMECIISQINNNRQEEDFMSTWEPLRLPPIINKEKSVKLNSTKSTIHSKSPLRQLSHTKDTSISFLSTRHPTTQSRGFLSQNSSKSFDNPLLSLKMSVNLNSRNHSTVQVKINRMKSTGDLLFAALEKVQGLLCPIDELIESSYLTISGKEQPNDKKLKDVDNIEKRDITIFINMNEVMENSIESLNSPKSKRQEVNEKRLLEDVEASQDRDESYQRKIKSSVSQRVLPVSSEVPVLTKPGYKVSPSIIELSRMTGEQLKKVENFKIWNEFGEIEWLGAVDVRGANLDLWVIIKNSSAEVYPEDLFDEITKPDRGTRLNQPALITLFNIFPKSEHKSKNFKEKLKQICLMQDSVFISYDEDSQIWKLKVNHFTIYSFIDLDDSSDEEPPNEENEDAKMEKEKTGLVEVEHSKHSFINYLDHSININQEKPKKSTDFGLNRQPSPEKFSKKKSFFNEIQENYRNQLNERKNENKNFFERFQKFKQKSALRVKPNPELLNSVNLLNKVRLNDKIPHPGNDKISYNNEPGFVFCYGLCDKLYYDMERKTITRQRTINDVVDESDKFTTLVQERLKDVLNLYYSNDRVDSKTLLRELLKGLFNNLNSYLPGSSTSSLYRDLYPLAISLRELLLEESPVKLHTVENQFKIKRVLQRIVNVLEGKDMHDSNIIIDKVQKSKILNFIEEPKNISKTAFNDSINSQSQSFVSLMKEYIGDKESYLLEIDQYISNALKRANLTSLKDIVLYDILSSIYNSLVNSRKYQLANHPSLSYHSNILRYLIYSATSEHPESRDSFNQDYISSLIITLVEQKRIELSLMMLILLSGFFTKHRLINFGSKVLDLIYLKKIKIEKMGISQKVFESFKSSLSYSSIESVNLMSKDNISGDELEAIYRSKLSSLFFNSNAHQINYDDELNTIRVLSKDRPKSSSIYIILHLSSLLLSLHSSLGQHNTLSDNDLSLIEEIMMSYSRNSFKNFALNCLFELLNNIKDSLPKTQIKEFIKRIVDCGQFELFMEEGELGGLMKQFLRFIF